MNNENTRLIGFLPWICPEETVRVGEVKFCPLVLDEDSSETFREDHSRFKTILSGYVDLHSDPVSECTLVRIEGNGPEWGIHESQTEEVLWAASALCLASISSNEYYSVTGPYSNSSLFRVHWQRFQGKPDWLALTYRRREGYTRDGGYEHGKVKFSMPLQCKDLEPSIDCSLLEAIGRDEVLESLPNLKAAVSFFNLAHADDQSLSHEAEVILCASAFEQLLDCDSARSLSLKVNQLLDSFAEVRVRQAIKSREGILLDEEYQEAQKEWPVHRKWVQELHHLRSKVVHGEPLSLRSWGWTPAEHLVMSAFVFPLVMKLLLEERGFYRISEGDIMRCRSVDRLLTLTDWGKSVGRGGGATQWCSEILATKSGISFRQAAEDALTKHNWQARKLRKAPQKSSVKSEKD